MTSFSQQQPLKNCLVVTFEFGLSTMLQSLKAQSSSQVVNRKLMPVIYLRPRLNGKSLTKKHDQTLSVGQIGHLDVVLSGQRVSNSFMAPSKETKCIEICDKMFVKEQILSNMIQNDRMYPNELNVWSPTVMFDRVWWPNICQWFGQTNPHEPCLHSEMKPANYFLL